MGSRIGIVSPFFPPHMGGVEQFSYNLAAELVAGGYDVSVITCNTEGLDEYEMLTSGVEVFRLPCHGLAGGRFPVLAQGDALRRIDDVLAADEYEGMLVNTRFFCTTPYALGLASRVGVRPFVLDHGSAYIGFGSPAVDWAVRLYEDGVTRMVKRGRPDFYGVSAMSVEWLRHFGIEAVGTIHNAIDAEAFRAGASSRDFRATLGIGADAVVATFTGRLLAAKGVWHVVDVARMLADRGACEADVQFVIAGDGPEYERLLSAAPKNVHLVGRLDRSEVAALLLQSDLFLFPSEYPEGMPTSVLEAAACGLTTIGTNVGGMREIMPDEGYGVVLESFDAEACVRYIEELAGRRDVLAARGARCRQRVEQEFSWHNTAQAVLRACDFARRAG